MKSNSLLLSLLLCSLFFEGCTFNFDKNPVSPNLYYNNLQSKSCIITLRIKPELIGYKYHIYAVKLGDSVYSGRSGGSIWRESENNYNMSSSIYISKRYADHALCAVVKIDSSKPWPTPSDILNKSYKVSGDYIGYNWIKHDAKTSWIGLEKIP